MNRSTRGRIAFALVALVACAGLVVAGIRLFPSGEDAKAATSPPPDEQVKTATGVVGETGFDLTIDGVRAVGPAGVAPVGTEVTIEAIEPDLGTFAGFTTPATTGVDVMLGDGLQPAEPVTLTFENTLEDADAPAESALAVAMSTGDGGVELADAERTPAGVVVTADHLSWFTPVWVGLDAFLDALGEQVLIAMQIRTAEPDCFSDPADDDGWRFGPVRQQLVWPCVEILDQGVEVALANNSPEAWLVTADQDATPHLPATTSIVGGVLSAAALQFVDRNTVVPMATGTTAGFTLEAPDSPVTFTAELDDSLTVVNAVVTALTTFVPAKRLEQLAKAQCFIDLVGASLGAADGPTGDLVGTVLRCFGDFVGGLTGALVGLIAAVPGALIALLDGVVRNIAGTDSFTVTLAQRGQDGSEITDFVGTWTGSIDQPGAQPYTVVMTITEPDTRGRIGTVVYPELDNCSGYLDRADVHDGTLRAVENITTSRGSCIVEVDLTLELDGPDTLLYDADEGLATGVLTRGTPDKNPGRDAGAWPTGRDDGTPALYAWAGANMLEFPEWVACDAATTWCVLGGAREHAVVEMDGLTLAGTVPAATTDAAGALAAVGVPDRSAAQILTKP